MVILCFCSLNMHMTAIYMAHGYISQVCFYAKARDCLLYHNTSRNKNTHLYIELCYIRKHTERARQAFSLYEIFSNLKGIPISMTTRKQVLT